MSLPINISKQLTAASANNIAASQSPGAGAILINGAASNFLSTTTTAATLATSANPTILNMTSTAGVTAGQSLSDSTASGVIPAGTTVLGKTASTVTLSRPVGGAGVGSGDTIVFAGTATLDTQRRVIITSGGNDSGITFTVNGAGDNGVPISETITGGNAVAVSTNLDFKTVTSVTHTGSVAGTITIGTNGIGATPWFGLNWHAQPFNVELAGIVLAGKTVNWSFQYTYDDPNNLAASGVALPQPFTHPTLVAQTASLDGPLNDPVAAVRLLVNSGTDLVRGVVSQAGISGQ